MAADCTYTIVGSDLTDVSYSDLVSYLKTKKEDYGGLSDILYSSSKQTMQKQIHDKLVEIKAINKLEPKASNDDALYGEVNIQTSEGQMSVSDFVNSDIMSNVYSGKTFVRMSREAYKAQEISNGLKEGRFNTQDEAQDYVDRVEKTWNKQSKNARDFHHLVKLPTSFKESELRAECVGTTFEGNVDLIKNARKDISKQIFRKKGSANDSDYEAEVITNVHLSAMADGLDLGSQLEILGTIDYCIIRPGGNLELYLLKTSNTSYENWDRAKIENYKMQLGLLSQMLAYNGFNTKGIELYLLPVHFIYDSNFEYIEKINVTPPRLMNYYDSQYTFNQYDSIARLVIKSNYQDVQIDMSSLEGATDDLNYIFPTKNIVTKGIKRSAKDWVAENWIACKPRPLKGGGYKLTIKTETGNEEIIVKDKRVGIHNKEFIKIIEDKISSLDSVYGAENTDKLRNEIQKTFDQGHTYLEGKGGFMHYCNQNINKYFVESKSTSVETENKKNKTKSIKYVREYDWEMLKIPQLLDSNIILMRNKISGQLDVLVVSTNSPDTKYEIRKGRDNLLGAYISDSNNEGFRMDSTCGNIEAIRAFVLLNRVLPQIFSNGDKCLLGNVHILCPNMYNTHNKGEIISFEYLSRQWETIMRVVNLNTNGEAKLVNNLRKNGIYCIDPIYLFLHQYARAVEFNEYDKSIFDPLDQYIYGKYLTNQQFIAGLSDAKTIETKIEKLEQILHQIWRMFPDYSIKPNPRVDEIIAARDNNKLSYNARMLCQIYIDASAALTTLQGNVPITNDRISKIEELGMKPTAIKNESMRRAAELTQREIDNIRRITREKHDLIANDIFKKFYKNSDYTIGDNALLGRFAATYRNCFQYDENGKNTFFFKDPYDLTNNLNNNEREMLKEILFQFYLLRCSNNHVEPQFTSADDPDLPANMPKTYLLVPLQKASAQTKRGHPLASLQNFLRLLKNTIADPNNKLAEFADNLVSMFDDQNAGIDDVRGRITTINPYMYTEGSDSDYDNIMSTRLQYIEKYGEAYFETNIENIFIDYLFANVCCEQFSHLLLKTQGIELMLRLKGIAEDNVTAVDEVIRVIDEYIKLNVFNKNIMDPTSKKVDRWLAPYRRFVTQFYVAVNPRGAVRDFLQGIQENFLMAAIKYRTNIDMKDVAYGYKIVLQQCFKNLHTMSMLNQFNVKYGFSAFDMAQVNKKLRTDERDISKLAYWTMRAPDYTNRMVLFLARLHHDGAHEAYSLDENGRLKYDWRKDKRFDRLANNDQSDMKLYNEQQGRYMSLIRDFNTENPDLHLGYTSDLPDAYTQDQIRTIKSLAESIYGSYDKSGKPLYENFLIGRHFMVFSTWLNGIFDTYFRARQISRVETRPEQEIDYATGKPLYFVDDLSGQTTTENTGKPVYKDMPIIVQGVFQTLHEVAKEIVANEYNFKKAVRSVMSNRVNQQNMKRLITDITVMTLLSQMFRLWAKPKYDERKKNADPNAIIENIMFEIFYKGAKMSYDSFSGIFGVFDYMGNSTRPAAYGLGSRYVRDILKVCSGKWGIDVFLMDQTAVTRSMQDSFQMWRKENYGYAQKALSDEEYESNRK